MNLRLIPTIMAAAAILAADAAQAQRSTECIDRGWSFSFGHAADPARDFGCGTEYFNYLTKAASIHNEGPYGIGFDDSAWRRIDLPHDWVVDLGFSPEASHSHGYKCVGWRYPENSAGWYRRRLNFDESDRDKHIAVRFDGIFRAAEVWFNGFYMGREDSGYATQIYDITDYIDFSGENILTVRVDATMEEGWYYEGAGIYRHVWLERTSPLHVAPFGTCVRTLCREPYATARLFVATDVENSSHAKTQCRVSHTLLDADGRAVASTDEGRLHTLPASQSIVDTTGLTIDNPHLWSCDDPYIYTLVTCVTSEGRETDRFTTPVGIRDIVFDPDRGMLLNGRRTPLRGVNLHHDHTGVGTAIPDRLHAYRLARLKDMGCNAIRTSHHPASPVFLDMCDREGFLVIEENRLMGINDEHIRLLERMIRRDRNHPSIIAWSIGNEEWGIEGEERGERIARTMSDRCHVLDPTRPTTVASAGGGAILPGVDVAGYNYLIQNPIDDMRGRYPGRCALGSEETSGCGTRGVYFDEREDGRMQSLNRAGVDGEDNIIARGWRFYDERPWLAGLFFWTGIDYRGESNPLKYPATGSSFGITDYCGFPKDEYYYIRALWRDDEPQLHLLPHWTLTGHEGETVEVWAYTNCDHVELTVNGRSAGRRSVARGGHASWETTYRPGRIEAHGYRNGRCVITRRIETAGKPQRAVIEKFGDRGTRRGDVTIFDITLVDERGRAVPTACDSMNIEVGPAMRILGVGNGDSAWRQSERPLDEARHIGLRAFNGRMQVIVETVCDCDDNALHINVTPAAGSTSESTSASVGEP